MQVTFVVKNQNFVMSVNAARAAETGAAASAASSTHDDATGSAETPDDKATRDSAKENAAAADESKAHKATEDMIATSEKRWGVVQENCATEQKETTEWIEILLSTLKR